MWRGKRRQQISWRLAVRQAASQLAWPVRYEIMANLIGSWRISSIALRRGSGASNKAMLSGGISGGVGRASAASAAYQAARTGSPRSRKSAYRRRAYRRSNRHRVAGNNGGITSANNGMATRSGAAGQAALRQHGASARIIAANAANSNSAAKAASRASARQRIVSRRRRKNVPWRENSNGANIETKRLALASRRGAKSVWLSGGVSRSMAKQAYQKSRKWRGGESGGVVAKRGKCGDAASAKKAALENGVVSGCFMRSRYQNKQTINMAKNILSFASAASIKHINQPGGGIAKYK